MTFINDSKKQQKFKESITKVLLKLSGKGEHGTKNNKDSASNLDVRILAIIGGLIISYQIGLFLTSDDPGYNITDTVYLVVIGLTVVFGIIVAKRYHGSEMFGRSYLYIAIGYIAMLVGDLGFYFNRYILEIDPYPSLFDIAFLVGYVFLTFHVFANVNYFKKNWNVISKLVIILIPLTVTSVYIIVALEEWGVYEELPFDLFWGSLFALGSSITMAFAVIGVSVFRHSVLKQVWLLLMAGITIGMLADVWYYYLETFEIYYSSHVVNTMWIASFMLIIYALIKHREVI